MKLTASQRHAVLVRIDFARSELRDLEEYRGMDWVRYQSDRTSRRNVERIAENVANAVIDVAKILLSASGVTVPDTYRDVLAATPSAGLADEAAAQDLAALARLRNVLAHRYLDYKWEGIRWFLESGSATVSRWLDRCERLANEV